MCKQTTMTTIVKACVTQLSTSVILMCLLSSWVQTRSLFRDRRAFIYIANETACIVDNIIYHDGDPIPTDDPCESCKCRPPGFSCVLRECKVKPGCKAIRREGECCPEYQCGCEHNGKFFNDGDHIPNAESPCYSCYCQGSSITCALADCKFRFDCEPEYVPNECCPRYEHCQPETPFWTTTSKRPIITRITTMSTAASPAPTTTTTTTTTTTPTPTLASSAIVTSEASQSTSVTATSETSANPEISSPLSPSTTTTISSMSSTLSKDEPVSISTQDEDKTTAPSSMSSASETSPPLSTSSSTTVSSIMVEATTNKLEDETSDTSSVLRTSTSDENTVTSSTISPSTLATNPVSIEDKSESLIPISVASVTTEKASYEPSSENPSESNDEKPSDEASPNETTTLSSLLPESPSTSEKSVESDVTSQSTETVEKVNQEDALTTPSIISSESDSDPGTPTIENKVEVTTISNVETNSEENEPANKVETKPDESEGSEGSEGSGPINNSESDSNSDSSGESKTEEESNSSNVENSDPVATTVSNEMSGETTTVGLEDNYLTTRHWIEDSELRAEHKNGDSDMIVESDLDHPNESPVMPASSSSEGPNYEAMDKLPEEDKTNTKVNLEPETTLNPASTDDHNANAPETFSEISINNSNDSNISSNSNVNNLNSDTSNVNGVGDITITTTISATL